MSKSVLCLNYANALVDIGKDNGLLALYKEQFLDVISIIDNNKDLLFFFNNPNIIKEEKKILLKKIMIIDKILVNFMMLLIDRNVFSIIYDIYDSFVRLANRELDIKMVDCYSANALDDKQKEHLVRVLSDKYHMTIEINWLIDTSLLAGIKLNIDNEVYDNSALSKLKQIKQEVDNINLTDRGIV